MVYSVSSDQLLIAIDVVTGNTAVLLDAFYSGDPVAHPALSPDLDPAPGYQGFLAVAGPDGSADSEGTGVSDIFTVPIGDDADGFLIPIDPSLFQNQTNAPVSGQFHPAWSPDGGQLAYFDDGDLAVLDLLTGQRRILPGGFQTTGSAQHRASWTSDGRDLIYQSPLFGRTDLAIIAADGSEPLPSNYTSTTNRFEAAPACCPVWDPTGPGT